MRRLLFVTGAAFGVGGALRTTSCAQSRANAAVATKACVWDDLSSDSLAAFAEKAFGVTEAKDGIVFTDILGLESELLEMVPGECVGVILCHPTDKRITALKAAQLGKKDQEKSNEISTKAFITMDMLESAYGGCGPCAVANVLANSESFAPSEGRTRTTEGALFAKVAAAVQVSQGHGESSSIYAANQHVAATVGASSSPPSSGAYHYTAFVPDASGKTIVELDSLLQRKDRIVWGPIPQQKKRGDFLEGTAKVLRQYFGAAEGRIDFAAVAVSRV